MLSRREFLGFSARLLTGIAGMLGLAGMVRFLSYQPPDAPPKRFEIGPETNYPIGSRTVLPDIPALLVHAPEGPYAISMVCTHLGCTVEYQSGDFICRCHGSRYDKLGGVTRGPAAEPLGELRVERTPEGQLVVIKS